MLNSLGLSKQAFVDRLLLQPALTFPDPINLCVTERPRTSNKVVVIVADVGSLGLDYGI